MNEEIASKAHTTQTRKLMGRENLTHALLLGTSKIIPIIEHKVTLQAQGDVLGFFSPFTQGYVF